MTRPRSAPIARLKSFVPAPGSDRALDIFSGKRRMALRSLYFDGSGLCVFYLRLERESAGKEEMEVKASDLLTATPPTPAPVAGRDLSRLLRRTINQLAKRRDVEIEHLRWNANGIGPPPMWAKKRLFVEMREARAA